MIGPSRRQILGEAVARMRALDLKPRAEKALRQHDEYRDAAVRLFQTIRDNADLAMIFLGEGSPERSGDIAYGMFTEQLLSMASDLCLKAELCLHEVRTLIPVVPE